MQNLILRVNRPYDKAPIDDTKLRYRLTNPYLYSFLAAILVCEVLCIVLYLTGWNFCASTGLNFCISLFNLHTTNPLSIALQVILLILVFVLCLIIAILIETRFYKSLKNSLQQSLKNRLPSQRKNSSQPQEDMVQEQRRRLGFLHPDIKAVSKPLWIIYILFLLLCLLVVFIYFIHPHSHLPFLSLSILLAFALIFSGAPFWHFMGPRWPRHDVGTSIADLSRIHAVNNEQER